MAGHHREVIQKGTRCNRLVERLLGVMHPQPSPALGGIAVQAQHPIAVASLTELASKNTETGITEASNI